MNKKVLKYIASFFITAAALQASYGATAIPETFLNSGLSLFQQPPTTGTQPEPAKTLQGDTIKRDSTGARINNFLDDVISGNNKDSLVYEVGSKKVYIYKEGDVKYTTMNMKADFMEIKLDKKEMLAYGIADSLGEKTRPEFIDGGTSYTMDTITYNIGSKKAKIKGVATQEGDGYLIGRNVKRHEDNSIHIKDGRYTTCDNPDHQHFYISMTRAKVIPGEKVIAGYSYLVMEDVPLYFLGIPEGFFPLTSGKKSGIIIPSYGEETRRGFFLRNGGYYFAISDHVDLKLLGDIYSKGSWRVSAESNYVKRYKFSGRFSATYTLDVEGEKGSSDYYRQNNVKLVWTHTQDPKFKPNSTFSANVNFSTSGYSRYGAQNTDDYINSSNSSSTISYSHRFAGTPLSLSANMSYSQNTQNHTAMLSLPSATLSASRMFPFKRKNRVGKQRWYEKIGLTYTGNLTNTTGNIADSLMFTNDMWDKFDTKMTHSIPVSTSFNLLNYINVNLSANYNETWLLKKTTREWDPVLNKIVDADTKRGFYRVYNYSFAVSANTKVYGFYKFKSKKFPIQEIRHTLDPTLSFTYSPNFSDPKFGFVEPVQSSANGDMIYYSPFKGVSTGGRSGSIGFGLTQTLEAKVLSKSDTSGIKKISIIDQLSLSGSYNLLADSLNLSEIAITLRFKLPIGKGFNFQITGGWDAYQLDENGRRINSFNFGKGKFGRLTRANWGTSYTFHSSNSRGGAMNDISTQIVGYEEVNPYYFDPDNPIDPTLRRQLMASSYYDFTIPWNLGLSYSISYNNSTGRRNVTQSLSFNGSLNLTSNFGITINGRYDIQMNRISTMSFNLVRDLHCWQMSFSWEPIGRYKSWQFKINVKSAVLQDLKYEKSTSSYDNATW